MKRPLNILLLLILPTAFACNILADKDATIDNEPLNFYVIESRAGAPEQASLLFSSMADLKPSQGIVCLESINEKERELKVYFAFSGSHPDNHEFFRIEVPGIPANLIRSSEGDYRLEHLNGKCIVNEEVFDYMDVSIQARVPSKALEGSLSLSGYVNGKVFAVDILRTTIDETEAPSYVSTCRAEDVDFALYIEVTFVNKSNDERFLTMNYIGGATDTIALRPGEEYTLRMFSVEEDSFWGSYCKSITIRNAGCDEFIVSMPLNNNDSHAVSIFHPVKQELTWLLQGWGDHIVKRPYRSESYEIR